MDRALASFRDGVVVEVSPPKISKARRSEILASLLSLVTIDDEGHWRIDVGEPRPACRTGVAMVDGQLVSPRWFIWASLEGPIPEGSHLQNHCGGSTMDNPCHNPEHFYLSEYGAPRLYCRRGHRFTDETLLVDPAKGTRRCLLCRPLKL